MKEAFGIFIFGLAMVFGALANADDKKTEACVRLDSESGFTRCATSEVVCYLSKGQQQCWPVAAPTPTPAPSPQSSVKSKK